MPRTTFGPPPSQEDNTLPLILSLYKMFGPDAQSETRLRDAQTKESIARATNFETSTRNDPNLLAANVGKIQAETGEAGSRSKLYEGETQANTAKAHLITAQMLQSMMPDNPHVAVDYLSSINDPNIQKALEPIKAVPEAVKRIRMGQTQPGDEDVVGNVSPITLAAARAEAAKTKAAQTTAPTRTGGYFRDVAAANPFPVIPGQSREQQLTTQKQSKKGMDNIWNFLFGKPVQP